MAGNTIKLRHDAERARAERYDAILRLSRPRKARDVELAIRSVITGRKRQVIRDPGNFQLRMKTKDPGRLALAIVRHVFAAFPVPAHLESVWLGFERLDPTELELRRNWYLDVAQGRSLYKCRTKGILTKLETHRFLNPGARLGFSEALWYAVARSYTENLGDALRIASSKVARNDVNPFWRDVARFFCANPISLTEINDICDFLEDRLRENERYSLSGRTLNSLRAQMTRWHRDLALVRRIGGGSWPGSPLPDWTWKETHDDQPKKNVRWTVTQIKTGDALAEEGRQMRHCVYSYKQLCLSGRRSIWSLEAHGHGRPKRVLTMEMTSENEVIQARGFANRSASSAELSVLRRWAIAHNLELSGRLA
jgi:hypothetical protein